MPVELADALLVVLALVGAAVLLGLVAYFALRALFERAAHRAADELGRVLGGIWAEAVRRHWRAPGAASSSARAGGGASTRGRPPLGRVTRLETYAAAEGISPDRARREFADSIERLARLMDAAIRLPVIGPVGLDPLLSLVPVAGDLLAAAIGVSLVARSIRYGVPPEIVARMLANLLVDVLLGAVPVAGDLADVWFRANMRNVELLRQHLASEDDQVIEGTATRVT